MLPRSGKISSISAGGDPSLPQPNVVATGSEFRRRSERIKAEAAAAPIMSITEFQKAGKQPPPSIPYIDPTWSYSPISK